jgi:CubicO group peptidase (beta-lactamase class C family)
MSLYFLGEGKRKMNEQQELEFPWLASQPILGQQADHRERRGLRLFRRNTILYVIASILLIIGFLSTVLGMSELVTPHVQSSTIVTHKNNSRQPAGSTPQITPTVPSAQNALIVSQVDSLLTKQAAHQQFSGSVLIARDGKVLLSKGYSMADWDHQIPNTSHTEFYLGSTTKQFTAMAILILQEQGKLHVHDRLCSYISPCPSAWEPVTIYELLTHTSGIPQLDDSELSDESPQAWIASYDSVPLAFPAGSHYTYCSVCYQILGYVVEVVSKEPYSTFLQREIFDPLQMKNTSFDSGYYSQPDHAVGYASWQVKAVQLGWAIAPQWSFLFGSGLLHTNVEDLYRWDQALYTNRLISQQSLNAAFTPYVGSQYTGSSYGYGWFIAKAPAPGHRLIWHDGRIDGFRTYIGRHPDDKVTIIFLSNLATLDELALANTLEHIVFAHV